MQHRVLSRALVTSPRLAPFPLRSRARHCERERCSRELSPQGEKRRAVEDLQAQVAHLQAERDSLKNMLWRLENDMGYVEKVAREEYGMSKKGERVYALPSAEAP